VFAKFPSCIIAPGEPIVLSRETSELDFEVELAIVIGKEGKRVPRCAMFTHADSVCVVAPGGLTAWVDGCAGRVR
jgi:2-keto-4-pentenoate hydratase/2-oxohepta-3-ene-1,7-dioic acid hydratase in catechol pathway